MTRISRDEMLMAMAYIVRKRSTCLRRQVGAVLAIDARVVSQGYNGAPSGIPHCHPGICGPDHPCTHTIHGEANAVAFAARSGIRTEGSVLYTTASPCIECAKLIINAGVIRVVYDEEYRDTSPISFLNGAGVAVDRFGA